MCLLVNGAVECTDYSDSDQQIFQNLSECNKAAEYRFYGLTDVFTVYQVPYEKIIIGCEEISD